MRLKDQGKKGEREREERRRPIEFFLLLLKSSFSPWPSPPARPTPSPQPPSPPRRRPGRAPGGPGRTLAGARRGPRLSRSFVFAKREE